MLLNCSNRVVALKSSAEMGIKMLQLNGQITKKIKRDIKAVQFGEGNFLRGFVDYMIDIANEKGTFDSDIVLIKPIEAGDLKQFKAQDCQYNVVLSGFVDEKAEQQVRTVTSVCDAVDAYTEYEKYQNLAKLPSLRFVISNTTEAGIVFDETDSFEATPPKTFPGKLCKFLYTRYQTFEGAKDKGLIMLPVELIDDNGLHLKECVIKFAKLWSLGEGFIGWLSESCIFTQTLVDRIITGYPKDKATEYWDKWGYEDHLIVTGEPFALWVIESEQDISAELPLPQAGLPVIYTKDHHPYKERKVRILNGAHTAFVTAAYLSGMDIVRDAMYDEQIYDFIYKTVYEEIIPTLTLKQEESEKFAKEVFMRFKNPYIDHALLSISLNSVSKWRARCLPSLLKYVCKTGNLPKHLTFSLAALLAFYQGTVIFNGALLGHRGKEEYLIKDDAEVLEFCAENSQKPALEYAKAFLDNENFWGQKLTEVDRLLDAVATDLDLIRSSGVRAAMTDLK